jgi:nucleotide-binding universal stress UspA family protein
MEVVRMFKKILVAVDGSSHARRATEVAADIGAKYRAKLVLLHVVGNGKVPASLAHMLEVEHLAEAEHPNPPNVANLPAGMALLERGTESREREERMKEVIAEKILAEAEHIAKSKDVAAVSRVTEHGDAAECILACAAREDADLIVMGTRGLSDLKGLLMGSVSHKICQLSECSCITVK